MSFSKPSTDLIRRRYSCRLYDPRPIADDTQQAFSDFLNSNRLGPLGSSARFKLVAATETDRRALKGLGTYGFIKNAPGFVVGAVTTGPKALEDYGYLLERAILHATDLGLGTCWLGGTFSKSRFAKTIALTRNEIMPAVASIGYPADKRRDTSLLTQLDRPGHRLPAEALFFEGDFTTPLDLATCDAYAQIAEAVRWGPSASNNQPWRILHNDAGWHFYLQRTKGYGKGTLLFLLLRLADLQRVDLGIALCHFEMVAQECGLQGSWTVSKPSLATDAEYIASWLP